MSYAQIGLNVAGGYYSTVQHGQFLQFLSLLTHVLPPKYQIQFDKCSKNRSSAKVDR